MKKNHIIILIISVLLAVIAGAGLNRLITNSNEVKPPSIQGAIYSKARVLSNFNLVNQDSQKITKDNLLKQWSLVFIGYTHCPDVCPTTMGILKQTVNIMKKKGLTPPKIIFITVDPQRDTVEVLKPYINYFNDEFMALTGSLEEIKNLSLQLNSIFQKSPGINGKITETDYLMDHSSALMLINPQGNLQSVLTTPHTPENIINSIEKSKAYYDKIRM